MNQSTRLSTPPLATTLQILAGDLLCTHAQKLLDIIGTSKSDAVVALQGSIAMYSETRNGASLADGAGVLLEHIGRKQNEKAPETLRCSAMIDGEHCNQCEKVRTP